MESIYRLVEIYLSNREAVLRALSDEAYGINDLTSILHVKPHVIFSRRRKPELWRPSELKLLADALRIPSDGITGLRTLAFQLTFLPEEPRRKLFKAACLNNEKMIIRIKNTDAWVLDELGLLATKLRTMRGVFS